MTTNYVFLGSGTTDSNGVAHLDHDADGEPIDHSYTGSGVGELDIVASLDDPSSISDSSLQSEPYTVWDTLLYVKGTSDTSNWNYNDARITVNYSNDGTHFEGLETTSYKQVTLTNNGARFLDGTKDYVIEYDIKKSYPVRLALLDNEANIRQLLYYGASYTNDWNHIKIVYDANNHTATVYVGDTALTPVDLSSYTMTTFGITFLDNSSNQMDFYLKNIKIYYG